jgi:hypothetical protein
MLVDYESWVSVNGGWIYLHMVLFRKAVDDNNVAK